MIYGLCALGTFCIVVILFLGLLKRKQEKIDRSLWYYFLALTGLVIHVVICSYGIARVAVKLDESLVYSIWTAPLFLTSVFFYILLAPVFPLYYKYCVLNKSPSNVIMHVVQTRQAATYEEIRPWLDSRALILRRLEELVEDGYVRREQNKLYLFPKGRRAAKALECYRRLLGWKPGG